MEGNSQEDCYLHLSNPAMTIIKLECKESLRQSCREHLIVNGPCRKNSSPSVCTTRKNSSPSVCTTRKNSSPSVCTTRKNSSPSVCTTRKNSSTSACMLSVGKMADQIYGHQGKERSVSATEQFRRKSHKFFDLRCPLSTWQRFHDEQ